MNLSIQSEKYQYIRKIAKQGEMFYRCKSGGDGLWLERVYIFIIREIETVHWQSLPCQSILTNNVPQVSASVPKTTFKIPKI